MTRYSEKESLDRLDRLAGDGAFDRALAALDRNPAILSGMGLDPDPVRALLKTPPGKLESGSVRPSLLEAIVRFIIRPPLPVENGQVSGKYALPADFAPDIGDRIARVEPFIGSVGRIEFINHDMAWGGTGWVIARHADHLLVTTTRHVARLVARRTYDGAGVFMFAPGNIPYKAAVAFGDGVDSTADDDRFLPVEKFVYLADDIAADIAIARLPLPAAGPDFDPQGVPMADEDAVNGECVAVIGYPARDGRRNDEQQLERYFRGLYDVKRFSPGFLMVPSGPNRLRHDCTVLGGNSGSPVISLDSGKVVGLHFAGAFGIGNSAVRISTLKSVLDRIAKPVPLSEPAKESEPAGAPVIAAVAGTTRIRPAGHFVGRRGYDPGFLRNQPVPLPKTSADHELTAPSDATSEQPFELRYQNFGILYSGRLKTTVLAALNIDGTRMRPQKRERTWYKDGRLPADMQLGTADYRDPAIDRGHLVRRAATNWGDDDDEASRANSDSFHYTVASPQHAGFNQSNNLWLGLEDYVLGSARTHGFRCSVFVGPILTGDEPELEQTGAPIPLRFFKVVAMLAEDETGGNGTLRLHATGYVLSQADLIQKLLRDRGRVETAEGFALGAYRTFQLRIADVEAISGCDFGPLRDADPLARRLESLLPEDASLRPILQIDSFDSIVL